MTADIIDGANIAQQIRSEVVVEVEVFKARHAMVPGLAVFLVGDDPASAVYVRNKQRACQEVGIFSETFRLPSDISQDELLNAIHKINADDQFHGILIQLPLPSQLDEREAIFALDPNKDVDGLHPINLGRLMDGEPLFIPGTPAGIQQLLKYSGLSPNGKQVVICGRSNIVGKPMAILMMQKKEWANATVTVCHTGTTDLASITRTADILISAVGKANAITPDMVREGAVVIDVGMNRIPDSSRKSGYRLVGDVDFAGTSVKASAITPVPGGVGPMTVAMLLVNTLKAAKLKLGGQV